jgi:hypothetical protein
VAVDPLVAVGRFEVDGVFKPLNMPKRQWWEIAKARFAGMEVEVEVRVHKDKRSIRANNALHAGLYEWAYAKGMNKDRAKVFIDDAKADLLGLCFGYIVRQNTFTGEIEKRLVEPHTSDLSVENFSILFEVAVMEAAKDGHIWTLPDEFKKKRGAA